MNVLVVDDETVQVESLARGLRHRGYQVLEALSAEEALKHLSDNHSKIDLVLLDYIMPGMNGIELLRNIRENYGFLPVIMMTAYGEKNLVIDALYNRCDSFMEKPFDLDELIREIEKAMENRDLRSFKDKHLKKIAEKELDEVSFRSYAVYIEGKILASGLNLNKLTDMAIDMFVELMRVEAGCLVLFNEKSLELSISSVKGSKQKHIQKESSIEIEKDVVKWIVDWRKPIQLSDIDELFIREFFGKMSEKIGFEIALFCPLIVKDKFVGLINLGEKEPKKPFSKKDARLLSSMSGHVTVAIENAKLYEGLLKSYLSTVSALAEAIETKDPYTRGHSERVSKYAAVIASGMNLPESEIERIRIAGILHDIGKIGVQEGILLKFAPLTDAEFGVIKDHPVVSARIIEKAEFPWEITSLARHHHERYGGNGYPDGLKGEDIPLGARILAVADTYEALLSDRPYRRGFPKEKVLEIIKDAAGTQLDPKIVPVFLDLVEKGEIE